MLADLPGPKIRAGSFPDGGVDLDPGEPMRLVPGDGPSTAAVDLASTTRRCSTTSTPATASSSATAASRCASLGDRRRVACSCEVESGGRTQGRPGVHLSCERLQMFAPTAQDLELAEAVAAAGVEYVALSFVRRAADVVDAARGRRATAPASSPRSRRPRRSASWRRSPRSPTP